MSASVDGGRAERVQAALYRIAELASAAQDMQEFYREVHAVVGELMFARNFFIALYDDERQLISWPYYVDEFDFDTPDPNRWDAFGEGEARGVTAYVLRTREPQLIGQARLHELIERGEIELRGIDTDESSWLGVPLEADGRALGVVAVQSYTRDVQYTEKDKELLEFVGRHIGVALSRARAIEETRQRNAELALINSVQEALGGQLELQAIYDVVGDKIQEVFDAQVVDIGIYEPSSGLISFPYAIERGVRFPDEPIPLMGFRKHVIETREPLMIADCTPEILEHYGNQFVISGEPARSLLYVPLMVSGRATGVISLQNADRTHAFTEADARLLTTLAGSLSVALDNARLVHETRQRNAELALINSVQESIAGELDQQAIYDLVGEKLRDVFDAQVVDIGVHDEAAGLLRFVYQIERGVHYPNVTMSVVGFRKHVVDTREPLYIDENIDAALVEYGNPETVVGEPSRGSAMFQPLVVGGRATGVVSIQNLDREHAFRESDRRLLATIAGSLGVALENAQLIHETRQRVAELATVNSVGQALSSQLELDALIELVGERVRETFDADIAYVALHDEAAGRIDFVYYYESGERRREPPLVYGEGLTSRILDSRESCRQPSRPASGRSRRTPARSCPSVHHPFGTARVPSHRYRRSAPTTSGPIPCRALSTRSWCLRQDPHPGVPWEWRGEGRAFLAVRSRVRHRTRSCRFPRRRTRCRDRRRPLTSLTRTDRVAASALGALRRAYHRHMTSGASLYLGAVAPDCHERASGSSALRPRTEARCGAGASATSAGPLQSHDHQQDHAATRPAAPPPR